MPSHIDLKTLSAGLDPNDPQVLAFVQYLAEHGLILKYGPKRYWDVSNAEFSVCIRALPTWATEEEMQRALFQINLAYRLNAKAHIAMSYPIGEQSGPTQERLETLFQSYRN